jgi:hypothetical protein
MPYVVTVALTVDAEDPDAAIAFVRAELAAKLEGWQTERPDILPRWQAASVRRVTKVDEKGFPVGE